jgi:hypothetical protein
MPRIYNYTGQTPTEGSASAVGTDPATAYSCGPDCPICHGDESNPEFSGYGNAPTTRMQTGGTLTAEMIEAYYETQAMYALLPINTLERYEPVEVIPPEIIFYSVQLPLNRPVLRIGGDWTFDSSTGTYSWDVGNFVHVQPVDIDNRRQDIPQRQYANPADWMADLVAGFRVE